MCRTKSAVYEESISVLITFTINFKGEKAKNVGKYFKFALTKLFKTFIFLKAKLEAFDQNKLIKSISSILNLSTYSERSCYPFLGKPTIDYKSNYFIRIYA